MIFVLIGQIIVMWVCWECSYPSMLDWNRNLLSFHGVFQEAFHGLGMELEDPLDTVEEPNPISRDVKLHVMRLKVF